MLGVILALVALMVLFVWRRQRSVNREQPIIRHKKLFFVQWVTGIVLALLAAFFMFDGDILGENTTGIARVVGIAGICLIATSNVTLLTLRRRSN